MSDNEVFECIESERELGEGIFVQGVQGLEFSFDVVLGGEEKSLRIFHKDKSSFNLYLGDERSTNKVPLCFCVPHKWCSNFELGTPAYLERESVTWCYGEKYIKRESVERYCEKKKVIKFFKVNRKYRELVERLGIETVDENNEYLPCSNSKIEIIIDEENNGIKYLPVVENYDDNYKMNNKIITYDLTDIDRTLLDRDLIYLFDI